MHMISAPLLVTLHCATLVICEAQDEGNSEGVMWLPGTAVEPWPVGGWVWAYQDSAIHSGDARKVSVLDSDPVCQPTLVGGTVERRHLEGGPCG